MENFYIPCDKVDNDDSSIESSEILSSDCGLRTHNTDNYGYEYEDCKSKCKSRDPKIVYLRGNVGKSGRRGLSGPPGPPGPESPPPVTGATLRTQLNSELKKAFSRMRGGSEE